MNEQRRLCQVKWDPIFYVDTQLFLINLLFSFNLIDTFLTLAYQTDII